MKVETPKSPLKMAKKYRKLRNMKIDSYLSPMVFTDPKMHENPSKEVEKHPKMAENVKNTPKTQTKITF